MRMEHKIAIIGLGYVGLPLAVEFAKQFHVVGFDINQKRIDELKSGEDKTLEVEGEALKAVLTSDLNAETGLFISKDLPDMAACTVYIVTVPTPTDEFKKPIFTPLIKASESIGKILKPKDIVIYESTNQGWFLIPIFMQDIHQSVSIQEIKHIPLPKY